MATLYEFVGITRQGFFDNEVRYKQTATIVSKLIEVVKTIRRDHPCMGARKIYHKLMNDTALQGQITSIGRDKFEMILLNNGLRIRQVKAYLKTTIRGPFVFKNLIVGTIPTAIDQVWVSDLTYFIVVENGCVKHFYITLIMDLMSRYCLGFAVSDDMSTESTTLPALEMALKNRAITKEQKCTTLIFHSDGGGQYSDKNFLALLKKHQIRSSMGKNAYDNPNAERLNGILKNEYLIPWGVNSLDKLLLNVKKVVKLYNNERPHESLKYMTPQAFEKKLKQEAKGT